MSQADFSARTFAPTPVRTEESLDQHVPTRVEEMDLFGSRNSVPFLPGTRRTVEPQSRLGRGGLAPIPTPPIAPALPRRPTDAAIRERAREIFLARNGEEGNPVVDWLEAEAQLFDEWHRAMRAARSTPASAAPVRTLQTTRSGV